MLECRLDIACIADPDSAFMAEWGECVTGELNEQEQVWSDEVVRAWTNFAAYGSVPSTRSIVVVRVVWEFSGARLSIISQRPQ